MQRLLEMHAASQWLRDVRDSQISRFLFILMQPLYLNLQHPRQCRKHTRILRLRLTESQNECTTNWETSYGFHEVRSLPSNKSMHQAGAYVVNGSG